MRSVLILPLTVILLGGCLTTQENPNYEYSTTYKGDHAGENQYVEAQQTAAPTIYAPSADGTASVNIDSPEAQRIFASTGATDSAFVTTPSAAPAYVAPASVVTSAAAVTAPTDAQYAATPVSGTPGFMALQNAQAAQAAQPVQSFQAAAPVLPAPVTVTRAPVGVAGTPVNYDYSRNIIAADSVTTQTQLPDTIRILQGAGQTYTVQQGDTVYSLARKTCVGVNVIQSMNGLGGDFGIKIGQSLRLPQSVC